MLFASAIVTGSSDQPFPGPHAPLPGYCNSSTATSSVWSVNSALPPVQAMDLPETRFRLAAGACRWSVMVTVRGSPLSLNTVRNRSPNRST